MFIAKNIQKPKQAYYIQKFNTIYDSADTRKNLYVDIRYAEMKLVFNENKIDGSILTHVAGNFNLPQGAINATLKMPGQEIQKIQMINSNLMVDKNFSYGYPDASKIYYANFTIDQNDDNYLNKNNVNFNINLTFNLNTEQLNGLQIDSFIVDKFIGNLNNINLKFNVQIYQNDTINGSNGLMQKIEQIKEIKIIPDVYDVNNNLIKGIQKNTYSFFDIVMENYQTLSHGFNNLFYIKNYNKDTINLFIKNFKIIYKQNDYTYQTNTIDINENIFDNAILVGYDLKNYVLSFDDSKNQYLITQGNGSIYINDNITGKYVVEFDLTINGKKNSYILTNDFSFARNVNLIFKYEKDNNNSLYIKPSQVYEEIQEE